MQNWTSFDTSIKTLFEGYDETCKGDNILNLYSWDGTVLRALYGQPGMVFRVILWGSKDEILENLIKMK